MGVEFGGVEPVLAIALVRLVRIPVGKLADPAGAQAGLGRGVRGASLVCFGTAGLPRRYNTGGPRTTRTRRGVGLGSGPSGPRSILIVVPSEQGLFLIRVWFRQRDPLIDVTPLRAVSRSRSLHRWTSRPQIAAEVS